MRKFVAICALAAFAVAGCTSVDLAPESTAQPPVGGLVNGPPRSSGNAILLSVSAAKLGALLRARAARALDRRDNEIVALTADRSLRSGQPETWENPETGNRGRFSPGQTYKRTTGRLCRSFTHVFWRDSERREDSGTACRLDDGSWEVVG